jgi:hypothetical protein
MVLAGANGDVALARSVVLGYSPDGVRKLFAAGKIVAFVMAGMDSRQRSMSDVLALRLRANACSMDKAEARSTAMLCTRPRTASGKPIELPDDEMMAAAAAQWVNERRSNPGA